MQTVLITGGTGLVGKALSNALLNKGYKVIILSRKTAGRLHKENISYARWNIKTGEIDEAAIQATDYIIHLAGAGVVDKKWTAAYKKEIVESRTESSRLIISALKDLQNKVKTIVSASAIGWYGADEHAGNSFSEANAAADNFLGQTCKLWEAGIEPVTTLGKRLVKLRMGIVLSNDGGALPEFKKPLHFGIAAILGNGMQIVSWIHINDLCKMFIAAIENESMQGSYNAVASDPVSNKKLTLTLAKAMKAKFYIPVHVPAFVLKTMMGERSVEVLKSATVSNQKILGTGFEFEYKTIEAAINDLLKK